MQPQVKTQFSVTVFPGGAGYQDYVDSGKEDCARIYFVSAAQKAAYIEKESLYTASERAKFDGAISKKAREEARTEYLKKRAFFARQMGYAPTMKDPNLWVFRPPQGKSYA